MKKILPLLLCFVMCFSLFTIQSYAVDTERKFSVEEKMAFDLRELGLFKGVSDTDFALTRVPSRVEAVVMLIRLLGKESEALSKSYRHPFTDVPTWANNYVGYAYATGLTNGTSATTFGTGGASAEMFVTFVLRALNYSDQGSLDFSWNNPFVLAENVGILPNMVDLTDFLRADAVIVSYYALTANLKSSNITLSERLINEGVFSLSTYEKYYDDAHISATEDILDNISRTELTAEEIYEKCASAVFYIEVFDAANNIMATGSGFFIDSNGTAVTNYHVIEDAYAAEITLSDTGKVFTVTGVYDYNKNEDWAVLKVDGSDFNYIAMGDDDTAIGGATVYAIGSPLGLQNTISQGLISNPRREENDIRYIQTTAAISSGSSGGALINKYGEVIGITSALYEGGQNLNLALPISSVNGYNRSEVQSFIYIITGNKNSSLQGYKDYPQIPDFGAFNAVTPYKVVNESYGGTSYYYYNVSLQEAGTYVWAVNLYDKVARAWGFTDAYYNDDGSIDYKCETATHTHYINLMPFGKDKGVDCEIVWIYSEAKKEAKGYLSHTDVPDFGEFFSVVPSYTSSLEGVAYFYTYSQSDLYNKGLINSFFDTYWDLLELWGFKYTRSEGSIYGNNYIFVNRDKEITVIYSAYDGTVDVIINYFIY